MIPINYTIAPGSDKNWNQIFEYKSASVYSFYSFSLFLYIPSYKKEENI